MSNLVAFLYVRQPSVRATEIIIKEVKIWGYSSVGRIPIISTNKKQKQGLALLFAF